MGLHDLVVGLCRASYYISLLGLKIPAGLLVRASKSQYVLAFISFVWLPFLVFCHTSLLPRLQHLEAETAVGIWHVLIAVWVTIPLLVVGAVILSFVNSSGPALAFLSALATVLTFHAMVIPSLAQTTVGHVLLHALFAFFEDMPVFGWIWCLGHVVLLQRHNEVAQKGREPVFSKTQGTSDKVLIVGNAPTVVEGEPLGAKIDDFSQVVRFNTYSVSQPEYTGSKVGFHFCNGRNFPTSSTVQAVCPLFNASLTHAVYLFMPHMEEAREIYANLTNPKVNAWFVEEEKIMELRRKIGCRVWQIPTSGMVAIDSFLGSWGEVTLHGFNFFQGKKIHYFQESPTQLITSWLERFVTHDPRFEKKWVEGLVNTGVVSFLSKQASPFDNANAKEKSMDDTTEAKKVGDGDEDNLRRRTPGLVRTFLKDGLPSQFSL